MSSDDMSLANDPDESSSEDIDLWSEAFAELYFPEDDEASTYCEPENGVSNQPNSDEIDKECVESDSAKPEKHNLPEDGCTKSKPNQEQPMNDSQEKAKSQMEKPPCASTSLKTQKEGKSPEGCMTELKPEKGKAGKVNSPKLPSKNADLTHKDSESDSIADYAGYSNPEKRKLLKVSNATSKPTPDNTSSHGGSSSERQSRKDRAFTDDKSKAKDARPRRGDLSSDSCSGEGRHSKSHKNKASTGRMKNDYSENMDSSSDSSNRYCRKYWSPSKKVSKGKSKAVDNFQSLIDTSSDSSSDSYTGSKKSGRTSVCSKGSDSHDSEKVHTTIKQPSSKKPDRTPKYAEPSTSKEPPKPKRRKWPPSLETIRKRSSDSLYDYNELLTQEHIKIPTFDPSSLPPPDVVPSSPPPPDVPAKSRKRKEHSKDRHGIRFSQKDQVKHFEPDNIDKGISRKRPYAVNRKVLKGSAREEDDVARSCRQETPQPGEGYYHDWEEGHGSLGMEGRPVPAPRLRPSASENSYHVDIDIFWNDNHRTEFNNDDYIPDARDVEFVARACEMNEARQEARRVAAREARRPVPTPRVRSGRNRQVCDRGNRIEGGDNAVRGSRRQRFVHSVRNSCRRLNTWFSRCWGSCASD